MISKTKITLYLVSLTILGFVLRLFLLSTGFNLDDAITHYVARAESVNELISRTIDYEFGPPLYFFIMQNWIRLFGDSLVSLAAPSVIFGTCLIPLVYLLAKVTTNNDKTCALIAAYLTAISPIAIFFSHEVRAYALLVVLSVLSTKYFFSCLGSNSVWNKVALFVSTTLLLYTHYTGIVYCILLVACYSFSSLFKQEQNWKKLTEPLVILLLSFLCFVPCFPVLKEHYLHGTYWVDKSQLSQWPLVFTSNLAACLPLPWLYAFIVVAICLPCFLVYFLYFFFRRRKEDRAILRKIMASNYFVFVLVVISAASTLGFMTPFILGYCRYLLPFAPLAWISISIGVAHLLSSNNRKSFFIVMIALFLAGALSTIEILNLATSDRNGLRQIAKDFKSGKYKDSAVLVCPDFDAYTFRYFMEREQKLNLPEAYFTYPRYKETKPAKHKGYAKLFKDPTIQSKLLNEIDQLNKEKFKSLIVIVDDDTIDSKAMPCKSRINELKKNLFSKYEQLGKPIPYSTKGRSFTVYRFNLRTTK